MGIKKGVIEGKNVPLPSKVKDPPFPKSQGPRVQFSAEGVKLALIKFSATGAMHLCLPMKKYIQKKQKQYKWASI